MADKNGRMDARPNRSQWRTALLVGFLGGVLGVLVDLDHLPALWGKEGARSFHTPLLIAASLIALYCFARLGGLLVGEVLKSRGGHQ